MTPQIRCPSCTHLNESGATQCANCNFPLVEGPAPPLARDAEPAAAPAPSAPAPPAGRPHDPAIRRVRPIRPRRPTSPEMAQRNMLAMIIGGMAVLVAIGWLMWTAIQGFRKNNSTPVVEGAKEEQQQAANTARAELARDSTNLNAQIALANVLYDTANWTEAIVHYKSALRMDPTRVSTVVDLGVCYYNLADATTAESLFHRALEMDPKQTVALFNLGIVAEGRNDFEGALKYYHRAVEAGPPDFMAQGLNDAIKRVMGKTGAKPPALPPQGTMPGAPGGR